MKFVAIFLLLVLVTIAKVDSKSYRNHKVVSLVIENETQLQAIRKLEMLPGFTFIDPPVQAKMKLDLVVSPEMFANFEEMAEDNDISFEVSTSDLQSWIDQEKPKKARKDGFGHDKFNTLDEIYDHLNQLALNNNFATILNIGTSFEGRQLKVIRYSKNLNNPAIFIEANIHAREWISSATAVWIAETVLTSTDPAVREIVDSLSWYILPVMNPDGFVYTHDDIDGDRLWRKTRSVHNIFCKGVDANRNFGFNWMQGGSSSVACTDTYAGPAAFSEKEAKAVMDFYATIADHAGAYIAFHCAAEMLLYPMGHDLEPVKNRDDLDAIAKVATDALLARHGRQYKYGNVVETLYVASGSSPDHAYGVYGTELAYTYEFRAGVGTGSRFILSPDEIIPNSEEVFDSILALITEGKARGYFKVSA